MHCVGEFHASSPVTWGFTAGTVLPPTQTSVSLQGWQLCCLNPPQVNPCEGCAYPPAVIWLLAPQHFSEISTATHLPPTVLLVNSAQQHTHTKRERKKKEKTFYLTPHSLCADPGQEAGRCLVGAAGCGSERADLGKHRMLVGLREQPRAAGLAPVSWEQPRWCGRAGPGACTDSQLLSADFRAAVPSGPWFSHSSNDPTAS